MFIDTTIFKIVARAGSLNEEQAFTIFHKHITLLRDLISEIELEYYLEKNQDAEITTLQDAIKIIQKINTEQKDEELIKRIRDAYNEFNAQTLKIFMKIASPGDVMYLKVYLKSQIEKLRKERIEKEKEINQKSNINLLIK